MPLQYLRDWPAVGARVALARRTIGLTQADLAARIGLDRTALAKIETGKRNLSALELASLARVTELPIDWLSPSRRPSSRAAAPRTFTTRASPTCVSTC